MKKNNYTFLTFFLCIFFAISSNAQIRYLQKYFDGYEVAKDVVYGSNLSVLLFPDIVETPLTMDVYTPLGDDETERPLVLVAHTGSFLPPYFNGGVTGSKNDSAVVNICKRLALQGYVVAAFTYRQGWNPLGDQDTRTGTLLQAAYRGIQDTRTCVRFFRKNAAEGGNSYGIDPSKIAIWGQGTGGYLSLGAGYLNRIEEVQLGKFLDNDLNPLADTTLLGNFYGTTDAPLCKANHPGYSSDISAAINLGGAMGDSSWIDGSPEEPATWGFHCLRDPFAPYYIGDVIVPTTLQFVVQVSGTRHVVELANDIGNNDILEGIPPQFDPIQQGVELMKQFPVTLPGDFTIPLGEDNMYAFLSSSFLAGPWDWYDKATLDFIIPQVNMAFDEEFDADTLHFNTLLTNPTMSAETGMAYLDTIFAYTNPRLCKALELNCGFTTGVEVLDHSDFGFSFSPNPALDHLSIKVDQDHSIEYVSIYDMNGKLILKRTHINQYESQLNVSHLPPGMYALQVKLEDGILADQLIIQNR